MINSASKSYPKLILLPFLFPFFSCCSSLPNPCILTFVSFIIQGHHWSWFGDRNLNSNGLGSAIYSSMLLEIIFNRNKQTKNTNRWTNRPPSHLSSWHWGDLFAACVDASVLECSFRHNLDWSAIKMKQWQLLMTWDFSRQRPLDPLCAVQFFAC